jgi:hypothetical protein
LRLFIAMHFSSMTSFWTVKNPDLPPIITPLAKVQQIPSYTAPSSSPPPFCPGDLVLVKISHLSREPLEPLWEGPHPFPSYHPKRSPRGWTGIANPHLQSKVLEPFKRLISSIKLRGNAVLL